MLKNMSDMDKEKSGFQRRVGIYFCTLVIIEVLVWKIIE